MYGESSSTPRGSLASLVLAALLTSVSTLIPLFAETVEVNGVTLFYEVSGSGSPLILIHGWGVHSGFWDGDVASLASRHQIIRYDRRGCGKSSERSDITADPADLKALLENLGIPRAYVMGHSRGTAVALTFAARFPEMVSGLILFGPGPPEGLWLPPQPSAPPVSEWVKIGKTQGIENLRDAIAAWAGKSFGAEPSVEIQQRGRALLDAYSGLDLVEPTPPSMQVRPASVEDLPGLQAPTLIILGEEENETSHLTASLMASAIPNAEIVIIPGGGHAVNWNEPERFAAEVLRFLRKIENRAR